MIQFPQLIEEQSSQQYQVVKDTVPTEEKSGRFLSFYIIFKAHL